MAQASRRFFLLVQMALLSGCNQYDPIHPNTSNLEGVWALDNLNSRRGDEPPVRKILTIYATHMEFCPGNGTYGTEGQWRKDGFWCKAYDGSHEFKAVKVISPEEVELHVAAFDPKSTEVLVLYLEEGNEAEKKALAAKYPTSVSYPPPKGIIITGMSEYKLKMLPWQADQILPTSGDDRSDDGEIYCYHSDDPRFLELRVTVKNHRVISVVGGNE